MREREIERDEGRATERGTGRVRERGSQLGGVHGGRIKNKYSDILRLNGPKFGAPMSLACCVQGFPPALQGPFCHL